MATSDTPEGQTWEGWWWFPDETAEDHGPHGTLTFTEERGARLRLIFPSSGSLGDLSAFDAERHERDAIHGTTVSGQLISLLGARRWHREVSPGAGRIEEWEGDLIVAGEHVDSLDAFHVDDLRLEIRGLREWLDGTWRAPPAFCWPEFLPPVCPTRTRPTRREQLRIRRRARLNVGRRRSFERLTAPRSDLDVALPDGTRLVAGVGETRSVSRYRERSERKASLVVQPTEARPLSKVLDDVVYPFLDLMLLALGDQTRVEGMTVTRYWRPTTTVHRGGRRPTGLPRQVRIYRKPWPRLRQADLEYQPNLLLPRRALAGRERAVLARWWKMQSRLDPAARMLFGVWNAESIYIENSILNLMSFAEAYHERFRDEPHLTPQQHRRFVRQAVKPLPSEARRLYREALAHANTQTQRERLTELVERAWTWVPDVTADPGVLVKQLVETRNHLTHWGTKGENVVDDSGIWDLVERLSGVIRINMLLDLEMDPDAVEYAFMRRYGHRAPFDPELA